MTQTDYKFYTNLRGKPVSINKVPKSVKESTVYKNLFGAGILFTEKAGRGTNILIRKIDEYDGFLRTYFPVTENLVSTKGNNIKQFKNSKARKTKELSMIFLRGFDSLKVDGLLVDIAHYTKLYGFFGLTGLNIQAKNICFVENKNTFLNVEKLLGNEWIYIHSYGRVGKNILKTIYCEKALVFVDYDFNGLDEYLRIKQHFTNAQLFIPENFNELFNIYANSLKGKQKASKKVMDCAEDNVIAIRSLVETTNKFLEQEILIND